MEVIGLGMNDLELQSNPILSGWVVHDLNTSPEFSGSFGSLQQGSAATRDEAGIRSGFGSGSGSRGEEEEGGGGGGGGGGEPFDAVICNVSIDYLTRPLDVMGSIGKVLEPGGSAYMAVSNRCFPTKVSLKWSI